MLLDVAVRGGRVVVIGGIALSVVVLVDGEGLGEAVAEKLVAPLDENVLQAVGDVDERGVAVWGTSTVTCLPK